MFFYSTTGATFFLPVPVPVPLLSCSGSPARGDPVSQLRSTFFSFKEHWLHGYPELFLHLTPFCPLLRF